MLGHVAHDGQDLGRQLLFARLPHSFQAGPNSAACSGYIFIRGAFDTLFEIDQPRGDEYRVGVGIYKARQNYFAGAIDFRQFFAVFLQRGMLQGVLGGAHSRNFSPDADDGAFPNDPKFFQLRTAPRCLRNRPQRDKLGDVDQQ